MRLVLDTNVVLEMLHWADPRCAALHAALRTGAASCHTDARCLAELQRVLDYPQIARNNEAQAEILAAYRALAVEVPESDETRVPEPSPPPLPRCRDADDQKFLELAARCHADLLITRDRELLRLARSRRQPPPFAIVPPERATALLQESAA